MFGPAMPPNGGPMPGIIECIDPPITIDPLIPLIPAIPPVPMLPAGPGGIATLIIDDACYCAAGDDMASPADPTLDDPAPPAPPTPLLAGMDTADD